MKTIDLEVQGMYWSSVYEHVTWRQRDTVKIRPNMSHRRYGR